MSERFHTRKRSTRRTDEQLTAVLDDAVEWSVNDKRGKVLYRAASLRDALKEAMVYQAASKEVIAVCQQPDDVAIIFRVQIRRLAETFNGGEGA